MDEQARLAELHSYRILDTPPEEEFNDLVEIASAICDTSISLISLIDGQRQWFKAVRGLQEKEAPLEGSFCQYALTNPHEVFVVDDPLNDIRFSSNRSVLGAPHIRFYAGAPLATPSGHVLGMLCVLDNKPHQFCDSKKRALQLLAKKTMDSLTARKRIIEQEERIRFDASELRKLTNLAPGCIYQVEMDQAGSSLYPFVSEGIRDIDPALTPEGLRYGTVSVIDSIIPEDRDAVRQAIANSYKTLNEISVEFRVRDHQSGGHKWYWARARPERKEHGVVIWYGMFQDITSRKLYEEAIEQISFDISHVLRRPVASMLGLTSVIKREDLDQDQLTRYIDYINTASVEMDNFTRRLTAIYADKKNRMKSPMPSRQARQDQ